MPQEYDHEAIRAALADEPVPSSFPRIVLAAIGGIMIPPGAYYGWAAALMWLGIFTLKVAPTIYFLPWGAIPLAGLLLSLDVFIWGVGGRQKFSGDRALGVMTIRVLMRSFLALAVTSVAGFFAVIPALARADGAGPDDPFNVLTAIVLVGIFSAVFWAVCLLNDIKMRADVPTSWKAGSSSLTAVYFIGVILGALLLAIPHLMP